MDTTKDDSSDVTLILKDSKMIRTSRNELSAASDFFSALFHNDMKENREGVIHLEHISWTVMVKVLEFMRFGNVTEITPTNAEDMIEAADYLLLPRLKIFAGRFLEQELATSNCVSAFYFAETYQCKELAASSRSFICSNFSTVAESQEFLNLESEQAEQWICSDEINVRTEDEVFKIILKWIYHSRTLKKRRKEKFEQLFRHVRLALISREMLHKEVATNKLVKKNSNCLKLVQDAKNGIYCTNTDRPQLPRKNQCPDTHIVVRTGREILCYEPDEGEWYELADAPFRDVPDRDAHQPFQMTSFHGKLYVFPTASEVDIFNPFSSCWSTILADQNRESVSQSSVTVPFKGEMYSIDTAPSKHVQSRLFISKYNLKSNKWNEVVPCKFGLQYGACLVAMDNYLYVLGGVFREEASAKAVRLDTNKNKWKGIADMKMARYNACGVAARDKIFIAGGVDRHNTHTEICEMYDVSTNEWHFISHLSEPRAAASMVCLNDKLYVVGGVDYFGGLAKKIESYDLENKSKDWEEETEIPIYKVDQVRNWTVFQACTMAISKEVLGRPI